nr:hypothetical protein [Tanacetum cinerariifolium]
MAPLTFADTHNMIAFLTKSDASEGFNQIVDFMNAHTIQYALMVNPPIYVSCIKQFWASVSIKKSNDVVKLQALINRKKVIITKDTIRQALRLDDVDGIDCLPNEEIFAELAWIGYEKLMVRNVDSPSMFLMYPRFLQVMINAQVDDLSSHNTKYTSPALTQKVFANMRRIGKGFSGVETPLFDNMLVQQQVHDDAEVQEDEDDEGRMAESQAKAYNLDLQHSEKILSMQDTDEAEPAEVEEMLEVVIAAKLMIELVTIAAPISTAAQVPKASAPRRRKGVVIQDPEETAAASVIMHSKVQSKDKGKEILIKEPKPLKGQAHIDMDKAFARQLEAELNANIKWNDVIEKVKRSEKQDNTVMRYQDLKRKPMTEAQARKNMMIYLKNMAGFKMDFFKEKEEEEVTVQVKRQSESLEQETTKKQRIDEEAEELKRHLQIIANDDDDDDDDDDVYSEATPLASKGRYGLAKVKGWKLFESCGVHIITLITTQMFLLVEKKYPLTHFTLEQMLNNERFEVEEESEMSLKLPRDKDLLKSKDPQNLMIQPEPKCSTQGYPLVSVEVYRYDTKGVKTVVMDPVTHAQPFPATQSQTDFVSKLKEIHTLLSTFSLRVNPHGFEGYLKMEVKVPDSSCLKDSQPHAHTQPTNIKTS